MLDRYPIQNTRSIVRDYYLPIGGDQHFVASTWSESGSDYFGKSLRCGEISILGIPSLETLGSLVYGWTQLLYVTTHHACVTKNMMASYKNVSHGRIA